MAVAAGCGDDDNGGGGSGSSRLVVSAAASMKEALTACTPKFDEAEDASVKQSFAGSHELAAQIRQGPRSTSMRRPTPSCLTSCTRTG